MNIITLGENRIRIKEIQKTDPYLVADVESYPLAPGDISRLTQTSQHLIPRLKRYMAFLNQIEEGSLDPEKLPDDPTTLAYLAAVLLEIPLEIKQDLLETNGVNELYEKLDKLYRREITFLKAEIERGKQPNTSIITPN
jgi:ATP-dependent Lon protease